MLLGSIARGLAEAGVVTVILDINEEAALKVSREISAELGVRSYGFMADVLDRESLEKVREEIVSEVEEIHMLINGAGGNAPSATAKLEELLQPGDRVVILVDDITRPTPAYKILPPLLQRIHGVGIPVEAVTLFMAIGTHRVMTESELRTKLGDEVRERYRIVNRDYRDGAFVDLGQTESGTPIRT